MFETVDGNALSGMLAGVFSDDATLLVVECRECHDRFLLAETVVERDEVAAIVRCRVCTHTLLTILRGEDEGVRIVWAGAASIETSAGAME